MASTRRQRTAVAGAATMMSAALLLAVPPAARASDEIAFTLSDPRLDHSSGLAADPTRSIYWTANTAADSGQVFGVDPHGHTVGWLHYRARPRAVTALAMHHRQLFVADVGDPDRSRTTITVYAFGAPIPGNGTALYRAYDFAYPDGPHDADALLVDTSGRLFVVTKEATGGIYRAPVTPSRTGVNQLQRVADAPAWVTDGVVLPDGRFALRSYVSVSVIDPQTYALVAQAPVPDEPKGESIAVSLPGDRLLLGSEGRASRVYAVPVPSTIAAVPLAGPTPPGSSEPGSVPGVGFDNSDGGRPVGTLVVVGLAALAAVIAGLIAGFARRRH